MIKKRTTEASLLAAAVPVLALLLVPCPAAVAAGSLEIANAKSIKPLVMSTPSRGERARATVQVDVDNRSSVSGTAAILFRQAASDVVVAPSEIQLPADD